MDDKVIFDNTEGGNANMSSDADNLLPPDYCPHCGKILSPWQKVLLNVDRALICNNCWYRIIYDSNTPVRKEK